MRFSHSDPDVETIVRRIERKLIDLQPDFQRGEVWSTNKKQRLIDSILRGWHIPPVHLVRREDDSWDVLDGQQRLTAIRDFKRGDFPIDGNLEPNSHEIQRLHGMRWQALPEPMQNRLDAFTIRVFELTDFTANEPYELFFRLNQPTNLTEAEKRNAFIGPARNQVKELSAWATSRGMGSELIGFGGTRMAYDDTISRFLVTLEAGTIAQKVTAGRITERYRSEFGFSDEIVQTAKDALSRLLVDLAEIRDSSGEGSARIKLNKATFHTWLCVYARAAHLGILAQLKTTSSLAKLELFRNTRGNSAQAENAVQRAILSVYDDRATSRVADVSSVILRDMICWIYAIAATSPYSLGSGSFSTLVDNLIEELPVQTDLEEFLLSKAAELKWGDPTWV